MNDVAKSGSRELKVAKDSIRVLISSPYEAKLGKIYLNFE